MQNEVKGYRFDDLLGKGTSSSIYCVTRIQDGKKFAIKVIEKSLVNDKRYKKYINNEIYILKNINYEYVIKLIEMKMDLNYIYLVFEYCNGLDLSKCLKRYMEKYGKPFSQEIVQHLMRQIISAFVYLHSCDIIHRDVKLENILVQFPTEEDKENLNMMKAKIKVTDFGLARYLKGDKLAVSILGNPLNMDPHIFEKLMRVDNNTTFRYDQKADIWSLGTCTYELLIGCPAFDASSYEELFKKIENGEYHIRAEINLSIEAISFISAMLRYDPQSRLDIESLSKQYFLTKDVSQFHNVKLKRDQKKLGESIILNIKKDENSNFEDLLSIYGGIDQVIDPNETQDEKPFDKIKKGRKISEDEEDYIGENIKKDENIQNDGESEIRNENKVDQIMNKYLDNLFDEMNKDCFYIEPLLIPIQPVDNNYNTSDPISKFMDAL